MKLDVVSHIGKKDMPSVIFIHGLGMDKNLWVSPSQARILGGLFPLGVFYKKRLKTLFHDLKAKGCTVIAWSQRRPAQTADTALEELRYIIKAVRGDTVPIILIGHSRGGLVARKYLEEAASGVRALITLATPHHGSNMAKWAAFLSPLASVINPLIPQIKGSFTPFKRALNFLESKGVKELLPDSDFINAFGEVRHKGIYCLSAGGTDPTLFSIKGISFPDMILRALPEKTIYGELKKGKGDGLVSAVSAHCPISDEHLNFPVNHLNILFDHDVRKTLVEKILDIR